MGALTLAQGSGDRPLTTSVTMNVGRIFSRGWVQRRYFAYPFEIADYAVQIDVHKTLCPFYTTKKSAPCYDNSHKQMRFVGSNALFSLMLVFTLYKPT